jgi:hypothetical protein
MDDYINGQIYCIRLTLYKYIFYVNDFIAWMTIQMANYKYKANYKWLTRYDQLFILTGYGQLYMFSDIHVYLTNMANNICY